MAIYEGFKCGDTVEIVHKGRVMVIDHLSGMAQFEGCTRAIDYTNANSITVLKHADHPENDPVGTKRVSSVLENSTDSVITVVKVRRNEWRIICNENSNSSPWTNKDIAEHPRKYKRCQ